MPASSSRSSILCSATSKPGSSALIMASAPSTCRAIFENGPTGSIVAPCPTGWTATSFDGTANEVAVQPVGQIATIEPVGPFPKIARQMFGTDAVMGADEPGFDVAEQGVDDREELAGIGGFVLHHRRVLQMLAEGGLAAAIAGEPVGQQMGPGRDIGLEEGTEFAAGRGRQNRNPGVAGEEPVLPLHRMPVFCVLSLRRRHLLDGGDDQALVGVGRAAPQTGGIPPAAESGLVRLEITA